MDVYPLIKSHIEQKAQAKNIGKKPLKQAVDYIDLRYDTGLAVGWKNISELSLNKQPSRRQNKHSIKVLTEMMKITHEEYSLNA